MTAATDEVRARNHAEAVQWATRRTCPECGRDSRPALAGPDGVGAYTLLPRCIFCGWRGKAEPVT
jgi:rRNA maturation protein Nop10